MKTLGFLFLLILSTRNAYADNGPEERWICHAQGKTSFGPPVGDIWQTVSGEGISETEAFNRAQQNCLTLGLQSCAVGNCDRLNLKCAARSSH